MFPNLWTFQKPQSDPPSDDEVVVLQEVIVACPRPRVPQEVIYIGDFRSPRPQHDGANDSAVGTSRASTNNSGRIANGMRPTISFLALGNEHLFRHHILQRAKFKLFREPLVQRSCCSQRLAERRCFEEPPASTASAFLAKRIRHFKEPSFWACCLRQWFPCGVQDDRFPRK